MTGFAGLKAPYNINVFHGGPEFMEFYILFAQFLTNFFEFTTTDGNGLCRRLGCQ